MTDEAAERRPQDLLTKVAQGFSGKVRNPLLVGKPRMIGHLEGREIRITWLGGGRVEIRCRARDDLDLEVRRPGWLRRLFGRRSPLVSGRSEGLHEAARTVFERYRGLHLLVRDGHLRMRALTGGDPQLIGTLGVQMIELAWGSTDPRVKVKTPEAPEQERTKAEDVAAGLRCPFCHDTLEADSPVVNCASCDAPHHPSCFEEGKGCSIAGCHQRRARGHKAQI